MNERKLFVLVPVYNVEKYLEECLDSILSQNYSNYEVIVVDDGATDSSGAICDRYAAEYPQIHVIHKENGGPFVARLTAIEFVRQNRQTEGTYCIFMDSDDMLAAGALETINAKIEESSCDMLIYGYENFDDSGASWNAANNVNQEMFITDMETLLQEALLKHTFHSMYRKAVKTDLLSFEIPQSLQSIQKGEDLLHSLELYKQNPKTRIIPDVLYRYRRNPSSITHTFKMKYITDEMTAKYHVVCVIRSLNIWTEHDFQWYRENCLTLMHWNIKDILLGSPSRRATIDNLKTVYAHPYMQDFCLAGITGESNIWLRAFSRQHFGVLYFLNQLRKVKHFLHL